jgi:diguanylate cyclase (GGDEF)-like protein
MLIKKGFKLKFAISMLVVITVSTITLINCYISYQSLKSALTENHLENNYRYTVKVAIITSDLIKNMKQNLNTLSMIIGKGEFDQSDLDRWEEASHVYFNSLFTADENGVVQLISPVSVAKNTSIKPGTKISTDLMKKALEDRVPFISEPYLAQSGNLMILLSYPVFDTAGSYQGVVDGTVYLQSDNSLKRILNLHQFSDESVVFVVDRTGRIIYHPDSKLINQSAADHPDIQYVMQGKNGTAKVINDSGSEFFSGYGYIEETGWRIIAQTPVSVINKPLQELTVKMISRTLPLFIIILLCAWILANHLLKPINTLAKFSEEAVQTKKTLLSFRMLNINTSIYEVKQLYQQLLKHFQLLDYQIQQDGLTGILNRRAFEQKIKEWYDRKISFSLILIDIDHFKKINDQYGHLVGDDVLKFLASSMKEAAGEKDFCFRYGGEEFAILTEEPDFIKVIAIAERLRSATAASFSPSWKSVTISIGIASFQVEDKLPEEVIKRADIALYQSKHHGRNKVTVYNFTAFESEHWQ